MLDDTTSSFEFRQCTSDACRFRFPAGVDDRSGRFCPLCAAATQPVAAAKSGRSRPVGDLADGRRLHALLDNVRSVFNVGSIFRTADGAGVGHLHLGGITPTPAHPKLAKTALGAELCVEWSQHRNSVDLARGLHQAGACLWALEAAPASTSIFETVTWPVADLLVLVVGNEIAGVDPGVLAWCDRVVHLPMVGLKGSLNVATAFGIAVYWLRNRVALQREATLDEPA